VPAVVLSVRDSETLAGKWDLDVQDDHDIFPKHRGAVRKQHSGRMPQLLDRTSCFKLDLLISNTYRDPHSPLCTNKMICLASTAPISTRFYAPMPRPSGGVRPVAFLAGGVLISITTFWLVRVGTLAFGILEAVCTSSCICMQV
jgi:hypothetical protein